jgi:hypothetical protein
MRTDTDGPLRQRMIEDMSARKLGARTEGPHPQLQAARHVSQAVALHHRGGDIRRFQLHLSETGTSDLRSQAHRDRAPGLHHRHDSSLRALGSLRYDPLDYAGADTQGPADLEDAVTLGPEFPYSCLDRRLYASPAELRAVLASSRQARIYALTNYPAFKFRKHS